MAIVAYSHPYVIGVDTHARNHALSVLACPHGEVIDEAQFPATNEGLARAVAWVGRRTDGDLDVLWVIEGTGTYGARLARLAADTGYTVIEAPRMNARGHRGIGKSDPMDARRIAQAALPLETSKLRRPRADDGVRAAVRILLASREHMSNERTATINALTALLRVTDLDIDARRPLTSRQLTQIAAWRTRAEELATSTARGEATRLAKRVRALDDELKAITKRMTDLLNQSPPAHCSNNSASAPLPQPLPSPVGHTWAESAPRPPSPASPAPTPSRPLPATRFATGSTAAATGASTVPST